MPGHQQDYDFTKLEIEKPRRRRRREEEEDEPRKDHGEIALFVLAGIAGLFGFSIFASAKTIIHEIFAALCFVIASILFTGGMVYGKLGRD